MESILFVSFFSVKKRSNHQAIAVIIYILTQYILILLKKNLSNILEIYAEDDAPNNLSLSSQSSLAFASSRASLLTSAGANCFPYASSPYLPDPGAAV
mmetsp:Transcript_4867/g.7470  ORF Transcript_4867/g.7470 Transcript_4867/m.7470 type:complete len:98 (-) Transcript_4867:1287-1580(-)